MALISRTFRWLPNDDGTIDGHYPDGDKPPGVGTLAWDLTGFPSLVNFTTGTPYSHDVRQYLTGTAAATATITIIQISGDNAASEGWSIVGGDDLEHPGDQDGSGFFALRATTAGNSIDTQAFAWSWVTPVLVDSLPPTIPIGFVVTPIEDAVRVALDPSTDPFDGTIPASLTKDFRLRLDNVVVHTQTAQPGLSPAYTVYNIGSIATPATPTIVRSGANFTLTAAGSGIHGGTADQCVFAGADFAGDFFYEAQLLPFTSANQYSTSGIMIRQSEADNAPFVAIYVQPQSPGNGIQVKRRATAGGISQNRDGITGITTGYVRLQRTGADIVASYSLDGRGWVVLYTVTDAPMNSGVKAGPFLSSQSAGNAVSSQVNQCNGNNAAPVSFDFSTAVGGAWTITARDNNLNESAASASIIAYPNNTVPDSPLIKWTTGHFIYITLLTLSDANVTSILNQITTNIGPRSYLAGIQLSLTWAALEGPAQGQYSVQMGKLRQILDRLDSFGKKLILMIREATYGGGGSRPPVSGNNWLIPDYIMTNPAWGNPRENTVPYGIAYPLYSPNGTDAQWGGGLSLVARIWEAPIMDRLIALRAVIGSEFNSHAALLMIGGVETALADQMISTWGYSNAKLMTQLKRQCTADAIPFPNTLTRVAANYTSGDALMQDLFDHAQATKRTIIGGPDPEVFITSPSTFTRTVQANRMLQGLRRTQGSPAGAWGSATAGTDLRPVMGFVGEVQSASLSSPFGGQPRLLTTDEVYDYFFSTMNMTQMVWYGAGSANGAIANVYATAQAHPTMGRTARPSNFPA